MVMASGLAIQAQAGNIPAVGDKFIVTSGTQFLALIGQQRFMASAADDHEVMVIKVNDKYVYFEADDFPHDCPHHGKETIPITIIGALPHDYFD
jgi:hypothetical protein